MMDLLMKIDMWFANWDWTDDIADVLWRGSVSTPLWRCRMM